MEPRHLKYVLGAILVVAVGFALIPTRASVEVANVRAANQSFGPPLVTATLTNSGAAVVDVAYWVETGRSGTRHCPGRIRVDARASADLSFRCPGLAGHAGGFTLQTGPAG